MSAELIKRVDDLDKRIDDMDKRLDDMDKRAQQFEADMERRAQQHEAGLKLYELEWKESQHRWTAKVQGRLDQRNEAMTTQEQAEGLKKDELTPLGALRVAARPGK